MDPAFEIRCQQKAGANTADRGGAGQDNDRRCSLSGYTLRKRQLLLQMCNMGWWCPNRLSQDNHPSPRAQGCLFKVSIHQRKA